MIQFGDCFEFIRNGMNVRQDKTGRGLAVTRIETISAESVDGDRVGYAVLEESDSVKWLLKPGDILFSHINSVAHIGKCAVYRGEPEKLVHGMNLLCLRCNEELLYPEFAKYLIRSLDFRTQLASFINKAVNQASVSIGNLKTIQVTVPGIPEQRRIAEVLDRAEELRAKRRAALAQLDTLTQSIFLDLFGDPATNPLGFALAPLEGVLARPLQNGAYFPKDKYCAEGGVEMVHMSDAFAGVVQRGSLKRVACSRTEMQKYELTKSDILVARRSLNYEGSVKPCRIPESVEPLIFESSLIRVSPDPGKIQSRFLYHYLSSPRVRAQFVFPLVTQSTISGISQSNLARVPIMLPPIALQSDFATRIGASERLRMAHRANLVELDALFASLQHRAFRGEL